MKKITLEGVGPERKFFPKKIFIFLASFLAALIVIAVILFFFLVKPVLRLKDNGILLMAEAQAAYQGIQNQDLNLAVEKLKTTREKFSQIKIDYQRLRWVKLIPLAKNYYKDGERLMSGAGYLLDSADLAVESLKPYADIIGFKGQSETLIGKKDMTAEERLMVVLDTLDKVQPNLDKIGEKLNSARSEIDQINSQRYPETLFGKKVREKVVILTQAIDGAAAAVIEAKPIISYLKPLLGIPNEKKYLILFQNDAELRPTGGFLTAYALLSVNKGNFKPLGSYDIYGLDARFGNRIKAPQPIMDYHKNVFYWHLRDMNLSPDFKSSMDTFWENFQKVGPTNVDGIIAIDTKFLVDLLKVLGPIGVADWGNFSAENDKRCNCPQVFYELESYADKPVGELKTERKAVLGPLMQSIMMNVMQSPRKKWPEFFNTILKDIQQKDLLFYFFDEPTQKALEALNASGRITAYNGDYFHLNDCNFAGAKSNMFIKVNVDQKIQTESNDELVKTVTVNYTNPAPPSNCNLESGELCLNGLYRDWVRLYVPLGSQLIEATGSEIEVRTYEDLGKTVFEAFYGDRSPLRPEGKMQLVFKYRLPFKQDKNQPYKLLIQKQPGTYAYQYSVSLNGKQQEFELSSDKEIKF